MKLVKTQIGVEGIRGPDGSIVESVPIYKEFSEKDISLNKFREEKTFADFAKSTANAIQRYTNNCRKQGIKI
jgi:hypothetical protein